MDIKSGLYARMHTQPKNTFEFRTKIESQATVSDTKGKLKQTIDMLPSSFHHLQGSCLQIATKEGDGVFGLLATL
jgi:hypothetical protein